MTDAWATQRQIIRARMKDAGISQVQLGEKIGVGSKHLSQMLCGNADGSLAIWVDIASELGLEWRPVKRRAR